MSIVEKESGGRKRAPAKASKATQTRPERRGREDGAAGPQEATPAAKTGAVQAAQPPLVHHTKSSATFKEVFDQETGEIQRFTLNRKSREFELQKDESSARSDARTGRFLLQQQARELLKTGKTPRGGDWRVTGCFRRPVGSEVAVLYAPKVKRAHFGGLMVCGSVWTCPCCAAKIGERRKSEVVAASDLHIAAGGGLAMVTYTFSHTRNDDVEALVKRLRAALVWLRKHRDYKKVVRACDQLGIIRALEVTHGSNGWHPHIHELWLTSKPLPDSVLRDLRNDLFDVWLKACSRSGLGLPNRQNGVNVVQAYSAAEYVAKFGREQKWGAGAELTKAHVKRGRKESRTPFDLLRSSAEGDSFAGSLFVKFAEAFFGSRQLFWTPGLKALFAIEEVSDEAAAAMEEEEARVVMTIDKDRWRLVLRQPHELRGTILDLAENGGADAVESLLSGLKPCCNPEELPTASEGSQAAGIVGSTSPKTLSPMVPSLPGGMPSTKPALGSLPAGLQPLQPLQPPLSALPGGLSPSKTGKRRAAVQASFDFSRRNAPPAH